MTKTSEKTPGKKNPEEEKELTKKEKPTTKKLFGISILTIVTVGLSAIAYGTGRINEYNDLASLKLYKNFDLSLENLVEGTEIMPETKTVHLKEINLAKANEYVKFLNSNKEIYFLLKRGETASKVREVGSIITDKTVSSSGEKLLKEILKLLKILKSSNIVSSFSLSKKAHAHTPNIFEWHGYENNYNYYEEYVQRYLIRRTYSDGAILQYRMSSKGYSISSTFRWITLPKHEH